MNLLHGLIKHMVLIEKLGANIPMGREIISIQEGTKRRLNEKMPWWQIVGGIFSMITAAVKAWESVQHLCCNQEPQWSCCTSGGESTGSGTSSIKLKESDLTNLVKRIINEQHYTAGGSGACDPPECDSAGDGEDCSQEGGHFECLDGCCVNMTPDEDPEKTKSTGGKSFLKKKNYWKKPTRKILKVRKHESRGKQGYGWDR